MIVAAWNVNSVKARLNHLLDWLKTDSPDVVLLQELKCVDEAFPTMEVEELGYNIATHGQKTYNGVAILSKYPIDDIIRGLPDNDSDEQARYIEAVICHPKTVMRVASVYVPNGSDITSDKFPYKLAFLDRLYEHCKTLLSYDEAFVIGGDYNIAPMEVDVHNPGAWKDSVLTHDEVRTRFRKLLNLGIYDAAQVMRNHDFSWWDYRGGAFNKDDGLRIDHLLLSPQATDLLKHYSVKKELRALEKASDHAPVVGEFAA
ncbi:MAG: exodeoxyribonuclease III [Rickettsiales bacterium]